MGSAVGTAAGKVGDVLGSTITAPFRSIFSKSCEDECGQWDGICFLQNACGASLVRLFKSSFLAIITVVFLYVLLWETGLVKCLVKKSCKLSWKTVLCFFRSVGGACGCFWHSLCHTRRVYRGRRGRRDVEMGELGWSGSEDESGSYSYSRKRERSPVSVRERRKDRLRQSLRPTTTSRQIVKAEHPAKRSRSLHHHHHHGTTGHDHGRMHWAREH